MVVIPFCVVEKGRLYAMVAIPFRVVENRVVALPNLKGP